MEQIITTLRERLGQVMDIRSALALLEWDQETYMPPKGGAARGQQIATLSALAHRLFVDPEIGRILGNLRDSIDRLDPDDAALVRETYYDYGRAVRLPESFVREFAEEQSKAFHAWVKAREDADFGVFKPHLDRLIELLRKKADLLGYEGSPYNALLEEFERGATAEGLRELFGELAARQSALVRRIAACEADQDAKWLDQDWPEPAQQAFTVSILKSMGYDLEAGRQDKSVHPFTTSFDVRDVRITTRFDPRNPLTGLSGSMHEGGHALYDQGFLESDRRTPLASAPSLGMHESQSRMWENMIGRSLPFWKHGVTAMARHFPGQLDGVSSETVYRTINRVRPSLIRVDADECTYNLHVILRFEIEAGLMENRIAVHDIPEIWNAKMKEYLGVDVPDAARGCLQDVHWSHGAVGYFPSYALGNLYAAQLFEKMFEDTPGLWERVGEGDFAPVLGWLRRNVHHAGRRKTASELIRHVTGKEPTTAPYLRYLEMKYTALYGLK